MIDTNSSDGLLFVPYTEAQYHGKANDPITRQKVRKHAWNAWRSNESQKRLKSRSTRSLKQSQGRFRLRDEEPETTKAVGETRLVQSPSPFQAVLESSGEKAWELLNFYYYRFRQNSMAINVEGEWISFTFFDQASRHAQLALIALNVELDSGVAVQELTMKHTSAAVKLIRSKLQGTIEVPDDSLIGAVALLVIIESMQGDRGSSAVHFQGLDQMVTVRGGLDAFSKQKTLQRVIAWARRCYWLRWYNSLDQPWIPTLSPNDFGAKLGLADDDLISTAVTHDLNRFYGIISDDLMDIMAELRFIASFPAKTSRSDRLQISQSIYDVEYQLMLLHQAPLSLNESSAERGSSVFEILRNAAQIYDFIALRQMNSRAKIVQHYATALKVELQLYFALQKGETREKSDLQDLLIWASVLFLLTVHDGEAFYDAVAPILSLLDSANVQNSKQLKATLESVAWLDASLQEEMEQLWKKISLAKL